MTQYLDSRSAARSNDLWSDLDETARFVRKLRRLCHTPNQLEKAGYVTKVLSDKKLLEKLRCEKCAGNIRPPKYRKKPLQASKEVESKENKPNASQNNAKDKVSRNVEFNACTYHPEGVARGTYTCCGTRIFTPKDKGCFQEKFHSPHHDYMNLLSKNWQYYVVAPTSAPQVSSINNLSGLRLTDIRTAIAIDCEFGTDKYNQSELIRLTAIDFFTKEILIDVLVDPLIKMKHYNTKYSGVRKSDIDNARRRGVCIFGRDKARDALARYINDETILIMHGGSGDLTSLRLIHPWIIDTHILHDIFWEPVEGGRSLKNLCKQLLKIDVQTGQNGHDSVEDAFACRELLLSQIENLPKDYASIIAEVKVEEEHEEADAELDKVIAECDDSHYDSAEEDEIAVATLRSHADKLLALSAR